MDPSRANTFNSYPEYSPFPEPQSAQRGPQRAQIQQDYLQHDQLTSSEPQLRQNLLSPFQPAPFPQTHVQSGSTQLHQYPQAHVQQNQLPQPVPPPNDYADVPFDERWDLLEPVIKDLYRDPKVKLHDIVYIMKTKYGFDASETQYKYRFKKWGWKKNISQSKKVKLIDISQKRASMGKSTTIIYQGQTVDSKKLRRQAKTALRGGDLTLTPSGRTIGSQSDGQAESAIVLRNSIFLKWNMPFGTIDGNSTYADDSSPFGQNHSTPSDIVVDTPPFHTASSPQTAHSPLSVVLKQKTAVDRARLFVGGKHEELLQSLNIAERKTMSTWLYQFWLFSFRTAKYWGVGPRTWTAENLGFNNASTSFVNSPAPMYQVESPMDIDMDDSHSVRHSQKLLPDPLCRWSIHIHEEEEEEEEYEEIILPEARLEVQNEMMDDQLPLREWPQSWNTPPFEERLRNNLENNDFSNLNSDRLPVAISQIAKAAERSPDELLREALGFAIMGRNLDLIEDTGRKIHESKIDISELYPYHLAASYLDGSKTCCHVFYALGEYESLEGIVRKLYVNDLGHTVLDSLMITILKAHSSVTPSMVDDSMRKDYRFAGEETDICGRWDADSDCYRSLLKSTKPSIPFEWKHKFCHTSIQAITHSIKFLGIAAPIDKPSGLFIKHCVCCGQKLQLYPLHTLVITAFYLGSRGCESENLFGMVACLLTLLTTESDIGLGVHRKVDVSLMLILGMEEDGNCTHQELDPLELANQISGDLTSKWTKGAKEGWWLFCEILRQAHDPHGPYKSVSEETMEKSDLEDDVDADDDIDAEDEVGSENEDLLWSDTSPNGFSLDCSHHLQDDIPKAFGNNEVLGHIWAAVQVEILTYRRQEEGSAWTSTKFDWDALVRNLRAKEDISIPLVGRGMMSRYCACGHFESVPRFRNIRPDEACAYHFMNMDDWKRTSFLEDARYGDY